MSELQKKASVCVQKAKSEMRNDDEQVMNVNEWEVMKRVKSYAVVWLYTVYEKRDAEHPMQFMYGKAGR